MAVASEDVSIKAICLFMVDNLFGHFTYLFGAKRREPADIGHRLPHNPPIFIVWGGYFLVGIGLN